MLKIRLTRRGKKNKAFFRLVVAEHTSPIKGRFLEALGFLNPHTKEKNLKADRIKSWIGKGAQCSDTAHNLLVKEGILRGPKRTVKMKKKEKSEPVESVPSAAEALPGKEKSPASVEAKANKETSEKKEEVKTEKTEEAKQEAESKKKTEQEPPVEAAEEEK
ncbi:MAG: 30S ribosomal protein S16 [Candidatus Moranbacteria bacterium GW2011_GWC1_45_18]|nr:MAG: 30S ribosomal protein S16 [Candidatus Moranbacteria bacterium GW2011_GWC2_40_12]KKT32740.1 MAG: 30S ribosomal protein S16 [Candidatus Moranbacteria bacterium GW2011_GWF2_44_10]KKT99128.1 MAG: 30S ribosomal protein S16 [Candidatus Moranbacteria bacterium GW2011_GWC1_45_18]OGI24732.1 MAG: 30S ribosomal protein S16 [Candidatus Moranbacteria bacterium RIFOXYA1_FULL_44_8]OGI40628.1 MAG: 30S ribosomal protein S16 [Candidatus Moranbacteria bacterium RIFOXYB1_FULL_44_23]OGI43028.1 MAG: 30S rib